MVAARSRLFHDPALDQSLPAFNLGTWFGPRPAPAVAALTTLVGWVASGQVDVPLGAVLPLAAAPEAHRAWRPGRPPARPS